MAEDFVATGRARALTQSVWWEVTTADGAYGWVSARFTARRGPTFDVTSEGFHLAAGVATFGMLLRDSRYKGEASFDLASELILRGSGQEFRRLDAIRATNRAVLLPVNFPKPPNVATAESALDASLEDLMEWDIAPENPARMHKASI